MWRNLTMLAFTGAFFISMPSYAQLTGTDTAAGSSCSTFPTGATRVTADSDGNGAQVTLVCDGTNWQQSGTIVISKTGSAPGGGSVWSTGTGDDIYYNTGTPQVGIGTSSPSESLHVQGNIRYSGTIRDTSDRRKKTDIKPVDDSLIKLNEVNGVSFVMKDDPMKTVEYGLIAQDVQKVFPELVSTDADGTLSLNYIGLMAPLVEAIKQLSAHNDALTAKLDSSGDIIKALNAKTSDLENRLLVLEGKIRPPLRGYNQ